jgi:hydroxymethylpyrimidine/phosphomethylpyrimidine kinase
MSFAASDPTSGGGLQGDVLTLASMGCHPLSVVTAIGVRDTEGADALAPLEPELVFDQARMLLEDVAVDAIKVGFLGSVEMVAAVADILSDYPETPVVLESALARLGQLAHADVEQIAAAQCELLLPLVDVIVLGGQEAVRLAAAVSGDEEDPDLESSLMMLLEAGVGHVLLTGSGQPGPQLVNSLYGPAGLIRTDAWERLPERFLGAGSTLSAALAGALALGMEMPLAVHEAQEFTWQALAAAYRPGMGQALPDRFFWSRRAADDDGPAS